ncbi:MAG: hypothetical protein HWD61_02380 [Parachlamydiaceae bacterium]|nr:MAG: hypothetical protein HWD61_02380 [Parachlamydiaceae bacterium]
MGIKKHLFFSKEEFTLPAQEIDYLKEVLIRIEKRFIALQLKKLTVTYPFEDLHMELGIKPGVFNSGKDLQVPDDLLNPAISYETCIEMMDQFFSGKQRRGGANTCKSYER